MSHEGLERNADKDLAQPLLKGSATGSAMYVANVLMPPGRMPRLAIDGPALSMPLVLRGPDEPLDLLSAMSFGTPG